MASIGDLSGNEAALARQAEILAQPLTEERMMANAIRALAIDAVEAAKSGHPGMPMGMADAATALWTRAMKFDAADPGWWDRDRFVLSAGHGSMLLYALLHLTGHEGMGIDQIKNFRQLHAAAAGHPEYGEHPAIEMTTGPLGQGLATAVGMALAERMLAAKFGKSLVDHRTWVVAGDGCLMEGVSHEAAALAGHLKLNKLTVLWDDNSISIDGATGMATSEDPLKRFAAYGWATKRVDGHDFAQLQAALAFAQKSSKPTIIACRTVIGLGAPSKAGTAGVHGAPLGGAEAEAAKRALHWPHLPFVVPNEVYHNWHEAGARGAAPRRAWLKRLAKHPMRAEFERVMQGKLPEGWAEAMSAYKAQLAESKPKLATRQSSQKALEVLVPAIPELVGGSADLTGSNLTLVKGMAGVEPGNYAGRYIYYGVREFGMAAAMNGLALHGGLIPYGGTFFVFSDYMRPAIRLAALMRVRAIHVLTHDSIGLGEDGPTHQPIEHLASFRAMPNVLTLRPADAIETAEAWEVAIRNTTGPSLLVLSRQGVPALRDVANGNKTARGAYVLAEAEGGQRAATIIATGTEVSLAMAARKALAAQGVQVAVVSAPSFELFAQQSAEYQAEVLGSAPRVGVEAACGFGWERWLGQGGVFIGMTGFGASAPAEVLYQHFGITEAAICQAVTGLLNG
ncbi:transketolase [Acidocella sp. KAb 2-4]|uniref:transketolase n=1 Tax=Acidocella sp. KAb 2-4 TaxID=2885158 RepID=UPI001D07377F|nr:transketolase [Acidocella sp. KAb 2-4]MCB5944440.1 transketolase [Acidocella sp. KAb 2-4]